MLRRYDIARFAHKHSPEKEQRLVSYKSDANSSATPSDDVSKKGSQEFIDHFFGEGPKTVETQYVAEQRINGLISETRKKLTFLEDLAQLDVSKPEAQLQGAIDRFFERHDKAVSEYYTQHLDVDFNYQDRSILAITNLRQGLGKEIQEVMSRIKHKFGPQSDAYLSHENFCKHFLRSLGNNDKSAAEKAEYETGGREYPNAFFDIKDQRVVFDLSSEEFNVEKTLERMKEENADATQEDAEKAVTKQRERAIIHEFAHYSLDWKHRTNEEPLGKSLLHQLRKALKCKKLEDSPAWRKVKNAVFHAFGTGGIGWSEEDIIHEGLAILIAGKKWPYAETHRAFDVTVAMNQLLIATKDEPSVQKLIDELGTDLAFMVAGTEQFGSSFDSIKKKMAAADNERVENELFEAEYEENNVKEDVKTVRTNDPDIDKDIEEEIDQKAAAIATDPSKVLNTINEANTAFDTINRIAPEYITFLPAEEQKAQKIGLEKMIESLSKDMNDLGAVEKDTKLFQVWEKNPTALSRDEKNRLAEKYKFADLGQYSPGISESGVIVLDEANKKKRGEVITELATLVSAHFTPTIKLAETLEEAFEKKKRGAKAEEGKNTGIFARMNKILGKDAGIHWLSVFDMIKIYNIYKDAILERYQSKQKIRIYDAAKDWNFYSPLQPDLDKQAKSANDEETSKFKEYLVKDGFTYDQLFEPGGVLDKNRNNINRAKAVIDYAADHAWLYLLNRDDGSNVYGIDYEGLWGKRTFEELVDTNSKAQDSEKSKGRSKVNNDPDIPLLVKEIKHELEKKNIWAVLGIVERLQEKAKFAESNTWALVAIIKTLQNDKDGTLRQVFAAGGKGLMDAIGGIGIGQSAWSLTLFKAQRHALLEWIKEGCTDEAAKKVGAKWAKKGYVKDHSFIPEVINHIEHELYKDPSNMDDVSENGVWRNVAKVLSTQVVESEDGKPVSIFGDDPVYAGYRDYWHANQTTTKAKDTDDDFFNPSNGGADILLLWGDGIGSILECTSLGQFTSEGKARGYLTQLIVLNDTLKEKDPKAYNNFLHETQEKLNVWLRKSANNANTRKTFGVYDTTTMSGSPKHSEKNILTELWKRNMINEEMFLAYVDGFESDKTVPGVLKPLRLALQEEKKVKGEANAIKQKAKEKVQRRLNELKS